MADRSAGNPESLKAVNSIPIDEEVGQFSNEVARMIEEEETNRAKWEKDIDRLKRRRFGVRRKKTFPWPNAANFVIPLIDSDIAEAKPDYVNLQNVSPVVNYVPYGPEDIDAAKKREKLNDWRLRTQVKPFTQINFGVDKLLSEGAVVKKVSWEYKTNKYTEMVDLSDMNDKVLGALHDPRVDDDMLVQILSEEFGINMEIDENKDAVDDAVEKFRSGETEFEIELIEIVKNCPQLLTRSLRDNILIPWNTIIGDDNLDDARFIDDEMWVSKNDIKIAMEDDMYHRYDDDRINSWTSRGGGQETRDNKYNTRHTTSDLEDMILLHETCVWRDVNDDGIEERCILTWPDSHPEDVLRLIELPYDHAQWPYTLVMREFVDSNAYSSRGLSHLDEDFQVGISTELNQTMDHGTIMNNPQVVVKKHTVSNVRNNRYVPGNVVETKGSPEDYQLRQLGNISQGLKLQVAQYLKGWANQRSGSKLSVLSDPTNLEGSGQGGKKTAKEIGFAELLKDKPIALNLAIYQAQMARVYYQIDALYEQFGTDEEFELITNENADNREKLTRREIQGKFDLVPNGRLDNSNPAIRVAKAERVFMFLNGNPMARQYDLLKWVMNEIDTSISDKLLKTPEEMQQDAENQAEAIAKKLSEKFQGEVSMKEIETMIEVMQTSAENDLEVKKEYQLSTFQGKKHSDKD